MKPLRKDDRPSSEWFNQAELTRLRWHGPLPEDVNREYTELEVIWFGKMEKIGLITPFQGAAPERGQLKLFEEVTVEDIAG